MNATPIPTRTITPTPPPLWLSNYPAGSSYAPRLLPAISTLMTKNATVSTPYTKDPPTHYGQQHKTPTKSWTTSVKTASTIFPTTSLTSHNGTTTATTCLMPWKTARSSSFTVTTALLRLGECRSSPPTTSTSCITRCFLSSCPLTARRAHSTMAATFSTTALQRDFSVSTMAQWL